jgi:tetratricopeptide (TPR) repeat protein
MWVWIAGFLSLSCSLQIGAQPETNRLQRLYTDAIHAQSAGEITRAQRDYQLFLANALEAIATARAAVGDGQPALTLADQAVHLTPDSLEIWMQSAKVARSAGALQQAIEYAQKCVAMDPRNASTHLELGRIELLQHASKQALEQLQIAVALDANYKNGLALARAYLQMQDLKNAAQIFSEMLHAYGDKAAVHYDFGLAYAESGFPEQAIPEFKRSIAENGKLPGVHYSLGAAYVQLMGEIDFPKAEREFQAELAVNPKDYLSESQLGYIALSRHQYLSAEHHLRRAAELNPDDPDVQLSLGQMYVDLHEPEKAQAALRACIQNTRDITRNNYQVQRAHYLLGRTLLAEGKLAEAKNELQISQQILQMSTEKNQGKPVNGGVQSLRVTGGEPLPSAVAAPAALHQERDYEKSLSGPVADSYNNLGVIAAESGQFSQAFEYFQSAKEWNPTMDGLDLNLGRAAFASKQYAQAVEPLQTYLVGHPENTHARVMLAACQFQLKNYAAVLTALDPVREAIQTNPTVESMYEEAQRLQQQQTDGGAQAPNAK